MTNSIRSISDRDFFPLGAFLLTLLGNVVVLVVVTVAVLAVVAAAVVVFGGELLGLR